MSQLNPDLDLLEAHALGELSPGEAAGAREWLIVRGDEDVLVACEAVAAQLEARRRLLELWGSRPRRARLERALWRLRSRALRGFVSLLDAADEARLPSFAALGALPDEAGGGQSVAVSLGQTVDLTVQVKRAGRIAVLAVLSEDRIEVLHEDGGLLSVETRIELPGFVLENTDEVLAIYVLYSASDPISTPGSSDNVEWLTTQLDRLGERGDGGCLRRLFIVSPT